MVCEKDICCYIDKNSNCTTVEYLFVADIESCALTDGRSKDIMSQMFCKKDFYNYLSKKLDENKNLKVVFLGDYFDKGDIEKTKVVIQEINKLIQKYNFNNSEKKNLSSNNFNEQLKFFYKNGKLFHLDDYRNITNERIIVIMGNRDVNKLRMIYEQSLEYIDDLFNETKENLDSLKINKKTKKYTLENNNIANVKNYIYFSHSGINGLIYNNSFEKLYNRLSNFNLIENKKDNLNKLINNVNRLFKDYINIVIEDWSNTIKENPNSEKSMIVIKDSSNLEKLKWGGFLKEENSLDTNEWFNKTMAIPNIDDVNNLRKFFYPKKQNTVPPKIHYFFQALGLGDDFLENGFTLPSMITNCAVSNCLKVDDTDSTDFSKKYGIKTVVSGHKPTCFPLPIYYIEKKNGTIYIHYDLSIDNYLKLKESDKKITSVGIYNPITNYLNLNFVEDDSFNEIKKGIVLVDRENINQYGDLNGSSIEFLQNKYNKPFTINESSLQNMITIESLGLFKKRILKTE